MVEGIYIDKTLTDEDVYKILLPQLSDLIISSEPVISNLANIAAALKESFDKISWAGFYLIKNNKLFIGPFQGKVACTVIEIGKGVCGLAVQKRETILVDDVEKFPGHIACDAGSKSEIVIPIVQNDRVIGVLDLDSYEYSSFNEVDKKYLERLTNLIVTRLDFDNFEIR